MYICEVSNLKGYISKMHFLVGYLEIETFFHIGTVLQSVVEFSESSLFQQKLTKPIM